MPDPQLEKTLHPGLEVLRTEAFPVVKIAGKRLIGDIGLRAFWHTYRIGKALIKNRQIDFLQPMFVWRSRKITAIREILF